MLGGPPDAPGIGCCCNGGGWPPSGGASSHSAERSPELNLKGQRLCFIYVSHTFRVYKTDYENCVFCAGKLTKCKCGLRQRSNDDGDEWNWSTVQQLLLVVMQSEVILRAINFKFANGHSELKFNWRITINWVEKKEKKCFIFTFWRGSLTLHCIFVSINPRKHLINCD